ncbi:MAG: ParB/RepB/Spo0J family partition protein [Halanaerobium sp.]|nr:ParB/RepB/Spo0J family partition protein [Halanaerobium sp.]
MEVVQIRLEEVELDPNQPRKNFHQGKLDALASSIAEVGQLQPVIVTEQAEGEKKYLLVAGERRFRAIKQLEREVIEAVVIKDDDYSLKQIQLIENLQREDLDPLEKALSIQRFMEDEGLNKTEASEKLGVPRTTLTEWLNILDVPEKYQQAVVENHQGEDSPLTLSHISLAKALAYKTKNPMKKKELLDVVLKHGFNRKETRELVILHDKCPGIAMEEAVSAILMKREKGIGYIVDIPGGKKRKVKESKKLLKSFQSLSKRMEEYLEEVGSRDLPLEVRKGLQDELAYLYKLLQLIMPDIEVSLDDVHKMDQRGAG